MTTNSPRCVWPASAKLGEGPLWSEREQALYWTDILGCRLLRYSPENNEQRIWGFDEYICALAERRERGLIVTLRSGFAFFDPASSALTPLHNPEPKTPGNRFNDGKADALGNFWAGTMDVDCKEPAGSLYRYSPDGHCVCIEGGYAVSNGPAWSADGLTMYHNDTAAGDVYAYDFDQRDGSARNRRLFLHIDPAEGYPDGMTPDADGGLWIAHYAGGKVVRYLPDGKAERSIHVPTSNTTSCTFGGPGLRTLYITTATNELSDAQLAREPLAGGLFACEPDGLRGLPAARFAG